MTTRPVPCARLFEVEALRDGRLAGAEVASFARHTATCSDCGQELRALDALAEALRASGGDGAQVNDLRRLRERTRLVAAFDATLVATRRRTATRRPALWTTAAALVAAAAVVLFSRARLRPDDRGNSASGVVVHAGAEAVWSRQSQGDRERVVLESGELWIQVDHTHRKNRLVVALPDGDLEDTGTTFMVSAAQGHTTRVEVREGSVVLRISGKAPLTIGGGETWAGTAESPPAAKPPRPSAPRVFPLVAPTSRTPVSSPSPLSPSSERTPRGRIRSPAAAAPPGRASREASLPASAGSESTAADLGIEFRAAVAVLDVGANREAAAAFARFLSQHPRDPRAEDAAYLQVIALQRCGAVAETKRAAQAYLRLFPAGFRRAEIEKLSLTSLSHPRTESVP